MDNELRIVQGNTFATAIEIHALDATGQPIEDWSLDGSANIRVWYVFAGREVDITTWSIENGKVVILWLANQQRVGAYDIFVDGVFNGGQWRNAMHYQFRIVRFNHEANIPSNVIILDGIYQLSAEMAVITRMFDNRGTPSDTTPNMDGEAEVGTEERYARGDHRHPSDTSKQDVISDLPAIRSGAASGATAYQKPATGIPLADLASGVQASLGKADTALQPSALTGYATETYVDGAVSDEETRAKGVENALQYAIDTKQDTISDLSTIRSGAAAGATAYQKPSTGIPKTDLASAVQTSLGKADTALQQSNIVDSLNSASTDAPLSANQGRILNETKQDTLTFDNVPTENSDNPVKSGGVYDAIEEVDAKLDDYAKIDGAYEGMLAGNAMNLVDTTGTPILREFVFSKSGGSEQIATGTALIKRIRGNTIVWNQLVQNGNFADGKNNWVSNGTVSNNILTFTGTTQWICPSNKLSSKIVSGHIVYLSFRAYTTSDSTTLNIKPHLATSRGTWENTLFNNQNPFYLTNSVKRFSIIKALDNDGEYLKMLARDSNIGTLDNQPICLTDVQLFDLTQMFGAGNEPTSVAEFESLFPLDYYEYDEGSLLSFSGDSIKTVGFNQWDEEWELGYFNTTTGENAVSTDQIRAKDYIHVIPSGTYYISVPSLVWAMFFDANKNVITSGLPTGNYATSGNCLGIGGTRANIVVMPSNCHYFRFYCQAAYGTTYNHDICINLSDPSKNGTYEPYVVNTKDISFYKRIKDSNDNLLFPDGSMHSAGIAYDEATENKGTKRLFDVNMGDLTWIGFDYNSLRLFYANLTNGSKADSFNGVCSGYVVNPSSSYPEDKACRLYGSTSYNFSRVAIRDDSKSSLTDAQFKQAMNGVHLIYELAEPIEVDIEEQNLTYPVDGGGTEQLLPENTSTPTTTPARLDVNYGLDAMATLKNLQKNYLAQTDLDRLLSAMGTALGFTYTKTWDATNNQWNFTITPTNNG